MADKPVVIDLDDLTKEMVEKALPHIGDCRYVAPCIIGTFFTPDQRRRLDGFGTADDLARQGKIKFAKRGQRKAADNLQCLFDSRDRDGFLKHPRIKKLMSEQVSA